MHFFDNSFWQNMFHLDLSILEKILRPIMVYLFLVVALRIFGKRELAQLNPFDLVVLLSLSNTVQNAIIGNDNSVSGGIVGAFTLLAFNYVVVRYLFRHRRLDQIIEGRPLKLIENGRISHKALAKELMSENDLRVAAHKEGFHNLSEIKTCSLEVNGAFIFEGKEPAKDEQRHSELLQKIEELSGQIAKLQALESR